MDGCWDSIIVFAFGTGTRAVEVEESVVYDNAEAAGAAARRMTPEPGSAPCHSLTEMAPPSSRVPVIYNTAAAAQWRGGTNIGLAAAVLRLVHSASAEIRCVVSQWEVHDILTGMRDREVEGLWVPTSAGECLFWKKTGLSMEGWVGIYPNTEGYFGSMGVAEQSVAECRARGGKKTLVVAHPDHLVRAVNLTAKAFEESDEPHGWSVAGVPWDVLDVDWSWCGCDAEGYWQRSAQPWTRNSATFVPHELYGRIDQFCC